MPLASGTRLGVYEVVGLLGAGGMGEVYRARDHRLRREVALKVLPRLEAADADQLARLEREAQLLAALSHPNIATIHGIEEGDGVRALVLELVEGQTLEDRLRGTGAIPVGESIGLARQLIAALEAAHGGGIIHRDLKPANIKLRPDGTLKVLDFGLARALEPVAATAPGLELATITSAGLTREGTILGTTPYMSPEQARGLAVDRRTDIWAFGCVLYEMLAGRRAFAGKDVSETIAFVLTRDPDWAALPAGTPLAIRRLLRRCLAKERGRRLADIADAALELDDDGDAAPASDPAAPVRRERLAWATGLMLLAALLAAVVLWRPRPQPDAPEMRADIVMPPSAEPSALAISPDGQKIVFVGTSEGRSRLWLRLLASQEPAQPLPGTDDARLPFWSPDSRSIGFGAGARLKRIDLEEGTVRSLAIAPVFLGGSWNGEGDILFVPFGNGAVRRIPAEGGEPVGATEIQPGEAHHTPYFLPDGRHFLFHVVGPPETSGVHVARLHQHGSRRLLAADTGGIYAAGDVILFTRRGTLLAQRFDPGRLELVGDASPVAENVGISPFAMASFAAVAASAAGPIVYRTAPPFPRVQLTWYDREGREVERVGDSTGVLLNIALSPDNQRLAAFSGGDIWMFDLRGGKPSRFTFDDSVEFAPAWSPDSSRVAISSNRNGAYDLFEKPATGAGAERPLLISPESTDPTDWSPDGAYLLYRRMAPSRAYDIFALERATGKQLALVQTDADERDARFSPDGRWIAYQSDESGRFEIWVQPFSVRSGDERTGKWQISTGGGGQVVWNPAGQELFFLSADSHLMSVRIRETADGGIEPGSPQAVFPVPGINFGRHGTALAPYAVSRDGQRFLFAASPIEPVTSPLTLLLNWRPERDR